VSGALIGGAATVLNNRSAVDRLDHDDVVRYA